MPRWTSSYQPVMCSTGTETSFHTAGFPGIFYHSAGQPIIIDSKLS